jgi:hypothetical protein
VVGLEWVEDWEEAVLSQAAWKAGAVCWPSMEGVLTWVRQVRSHRRTPREAVKFQASHPQAKRARLCDLEPMIDSSENSLSSSLTTGL